MNIITTKIAQVTKPNISPLETKTLVIVAFLRLYIFLKFFYLYHYFVNLSC